MTYLTLSELSEPQLLYALAKQATDMERGFTIQTSYGDITIDAQHAAPFVAMTKAVLRTQLTQHCGESTHGY